MRPGPQRGLGTCPLLGCCCCYSPSSPSLPASPSPSVSGSPSYRRSPRWILLLTLLLLQLSCWLPDVHGARRQPPATSGDRLELLPSAASYQRGPVRTLSAADRFKGLPRGGSGGEFNPLHPPFHPVMASFNLLGQHANPVHAAASSGASNSLVLGILGGGGSSGGGGGMGSSSSNTGGGGGGGVAPGLVPAAAVSSISSGPPIGGNPEGSIIRLMSKSYRYLQILPNGTVTATTHEGSEYAILEQAAVQIGHVYIRGMASRHYLCLNKCGMLYGSRNLSEECILRENIEKNWYNTYTSSRYSTEDKTLYVALSTTTGSACKLRLQTVRSPEGHIISSLGTNDQFTQFFPVRNVTLPEGMNLASLSKQWANAAPHHHHQYPLPPEAGRCAERCTQVPTSNSPSTHPSSLPSPSHKPSKKKPKCPPCLDTPSTGAQGERCRRPKHCRRPPAPKNAVTTTSAPPARKPKPKASDADARRGTTTSATRRPDKEKSPSKHRGDPADTNQVTRKPKKPKHTRRPVPSSPTPTSSPTRRHRIHQQQNQQQQSSGQGRRRAPLTQPEQASPPAVRALDASRPTKASSLSSSTKVPVMPHKVRHAHRKSRAHPELFLPEATPPAA